MRDGPAPNGAAGSEEEKVFEARIRRLTSVRNLEGHRDPDGPGLGPVRGPKGRRRRPTSIVLRRASSRSRQPSQSVRWLRHERWIHLVRQPPIAPSTRLYSAQIVACSMQFPLREKIAGEIALSDQPGKTMRKWREELRISQTELATHMRVSPSVISDYEAGRRTSPGIKTIHRLVDALLEIDQRTGQKLTKRFQEYSDVIPSMRDWAVGVRAADFLRKIDGKLLTQKLNTRRIVNGYTVIDSMKAITTLDASDYLQIYGSTSERALFFTGVKYGRSPMIAIKAHPLKPAMVVYVQPENIDELAVKLAELDNILLARTELDQGELISRLERIA